jgi:hypothetical protein
MTRRAAPPLVVLAMLILAPHGAIAADADRDGLRDGFEQRSGVTDPQRRDSDADGIIDAAEDIDGDRLSGLGEQRYRTDPGRRDSDGDGVQDGAEDADRDGRSNAREQDQRPVPRGLTPSLRAAPTAWPAARPRCQTPQGKSEIRPCSFGDPNGAITVLLFGDSHATQWLPALTMTGKREGWRIRMITKTGCPSVDLTPASQQAIDGGRSCRAWRARAFDWIRDRRPDVVVVSNLRSTLVSESTWRAALTRTLRALPRRTHPVVLADTPRLRLLPAPCLARHHTNISACVTQRASAFHPGHDRVERAAARSADGSFIDLSRKVCPYDPCPLVIGDTMLWRDQAHITARFSRQLGPSLRRSLRAALQDVLPSFGRRP